MGGWKSEWQMLLHNFNPTFIASLNIVNIGLRNLKNNEFISGYSQK
jgi:hypothetical protein